MLARHGRVLALFRGRVRIVSLSSSASARDFVSSRRRQGGADGRRWLSTKVEEEKKTGPGYETEEEAIKRINASDALETDYDLSVFKPAGVSQEDHDKMMADIAEIEDREEAAVEKPPIQMGCGRDKTDPEVLKKEVAHYKKVVGGMQEELRRLISVYDYEPAVTLSEELVAMCVEAYGATRNPVLAAAYSDQGMAHKGRGHYQFAVESFAESVKMYDKCSLKEHSPTATALHNLGACFKDNALTSKSPLDRGILLDRALEALEESQVRRKGRAYVEAIDGPLLATTGLVVASCLRLQGKKTASDLAIAEAVFRLRRATIDAPSSKDAKTALAAAINNQALYASKDAKPTELVQQLFAEALRLRESVLDRDHPLVIATLHNLAEHLLLVENPKADDVQMDILDRLGVEDAWEAKDKRDKPPEPDDADAMKHITISTSPKKKKAWEEDKDVLDVVGTPLSTKKQEEEDEEIPWVIATAIPAKKPEERNEPRLK